MLQDTLQALGSEVRAAGGGRAARRTAQPQEIRVRWTDADGRSQTFGADEAAEQAAGIHGSVELIYVAEGAYCAQLQESAIRVEEGQFCLIDKDTFHQDLEAEPFTALFLRLPDALLDEALQHPLGEEAGTSNRMLRYVLNTLHRRSRNAFLVFRPQREPVERCLDAMLTEQRQRQDGWLYLCQGWLIRMLSLLTPAAYAALEGDERAQVRQILGDEIVQYMTDHMVTVTPEELARVFHFQKDYFNRLIRRQFGQSYTELLHHVRMSRAAWLLANTETPIGEIIRRIGYSNTGYFHELFRQRFHMTPRQYRELSWRKPRYVVVGQVSDTEP